jgi:hypothetical protein
MILSYGARYDRNRFRLVKFDDLDWLHVVVIELLRMYVKIGCHVYIICLINGLDACGLVEMLMCVCLDYCIAYVMFGENLFGFLAFGS